MSSRQFEGLNRSCELGWITTQPFGLQRHNNSKRRYVTFPCFARLYLLLFFLFSSISRNGSSCLIPSTRPFSSGLTSGRQVPSTSSARKCNRLWLPQHNNVVATSTQQCPLLNTNLNNFLKHKTCRIRLTLVWNTCKP